MTRYRVEAKCKSCKDMTLEGEIVCADDESAHMLAYVVSRGWAVGHVKHDQFVVLHAVDD